MSGTISAEEGALKKGAEAVNKAKGGIDQRVKNVRGEIDQLRGFWTGAAAGSFTTLMTRWDEETRKLNEVLVTLENALRGTEKDQAATEEQHQQSVANLNSLMG